MESRAQGGSDLPKVTGLNQRPSWKQHSWMLAPEVRTHHHRPNPLPRAPKQKTQSGRQQQGRTVTCLPKPRESTPTICCTDWKLGVQVRARYRLPVLKPGESIANESLQCPVHIWGSSAFRPEPWVCSSDSCRGAVFQEGLMTHVTVSTLPTWASPGLVPS